MQRRGGWKVLFSGHDNQPLLVTEVEQQDGEVEDESEQSVHDVGDEWASRTMRRRRGAFAVWEEEEEAYRASPEPGSGEAERGISMVLWR